MFRKKEKEGASARFPKFPSNLDFKFLLFAKKSLDQITSITLIYLLHPEIWFGCVALN